MMFAKCSIVSQNIVYSIITVSYTHLQTMPDYAYMYAIPYELYEKYGVRRYGCLLYTSRCV